MLHHICRLLTHLQARAARAGRQGLAEHIWQGNERLEHRGCGGDGCADRAHAKDRHGGKVIPAKGRQRHGEGSQGVGHCARPFTPYSHHIVVRPREQQQRDFQDVQGRYEPGFQLLAHAVPRSVSLASSLCARSARYHVSMHTEIPLQVHSTTIHARRAVLNTRASTLTSFSPPPPALHTPA
jgi:hypothetical protein